MRVQAPGEAAVAYRQTAIHDGRGMPRSDISPDPNHNNYNGSYYICL